MDSQKILRITRRKEIIKLKGLKYSDLGVPAEISQVILEKRKTRKVQARIARRVGVRKSIFWSDSVIKLTDASNIPSI